MDKKDVLNLLSKKMNGDLNMSYDHLATLTGYSKRQLLRLPKSINEKGIDSTLSHGNKGSTANNRASNSEIDYILISKSYTLISL